VLAVSAAPYAPNRPQGNFEETSKPLLNETRPPLPAQPGKPQRFEYASARQGPRHPLLWVEPPAGRRHGQVTEPRPQLALAYAMQWLRDKGDPAAAVSRGVLDHLHTQKRAALSEACEPAEARRMARKLELHYTPQQGSWLNMAASDLRVLQRQCLDRRLPDAGTLQREMAAWEPQRHTAQATSDGRFSVSDARHKLERLSPSLPA
jgi:hypothetical protein